MGMRMCIKQIIITCVLAFFSTGYAATADAFGLAVSASSDASVYGRGQTVFISTVAQYTDGNPIEKIKKAQIRIKDSRGEEVRRAELTRMDPNSFSYEYPLPQEARSGIWEFRIKIDDEYGNKGEVKIKIEVNDSGLPSGDPAGLDLKVVLNDTTYSSGQTISITADALNAIGGSLGDLRKSEVRIKDGEKEEVFKGSLINYGNDSFGYDYVIPSSSEDGEWEVKVSFEDEKRNKGDIRIKIKVDDDSDDSNSYFDMDGDGFNTAVDCNDNDASINPGAADTACDGIDQDCSGSDAVDASCTDNDADGYTADVDCNDSDSTINPGAEDIACDGVDQNCNGSDTITDACIDADNDGFFCECRL